MARLEVALRRDAGGFTLDVAWEADDGIVVLFGPSGAGKTLTLQCLAGLLPPDRGRVSVDGRVVFDSAGGVDVPPEARRVGYVFQGYALFPHLTVAANVGFGLRGPRGPRADGPRGRRADGWGRAARRGRVDELLARFGLVSLADRRPRELSGGERQRVALARALAPEPALVLLDEPLSALDAPARRELRDDLRHTLAALGTVAVVVTHDFTEAYRLADRIVVYDRGRVVQAAEREALLWQPDSETVARIMGVRNVLRGEVVRAAADRILFQWRGQRLEAVNSPRRAWLPAAGTELAFFIRPEYVRLIRKDRAAPDPGHHMNVLGGEIVEALDFGTTWALRVRLDAPGVPAQGAFDLEVEVPRLVYEILDIARDRRWDFSIHRGSIQVLPG